MEAGLAGVPGPAATSAAAAGAPYARAPAPAPHPRTEGGSAKERRTRSNRATPNPAVRQSHLRVRAGSLNEDRCDPVGGSSRAKMITH